jgi:hypothetical protein
MALSEVSPTGADGRHNVTMQGNSSFTANLNAATYVELPDQKGKMPATGSALTQSITGRLA